MASSTALKLQQSPLAAALPGCWTLAPERAFTLDAAQPGILRVAQGRLWATRKGPHHGPANDWGDVVLCAGEQLTLLAGQQLVVESFGDAVNEAVYFSWEPSTTRVAAQPAEPSLWHDPLARPALDLGASLRLLVGAAGRALAAIAHALQFLVAGKGRVMARLEANQP